MNAFAVFNLITMVTTLFLAILIFMYGDIRKTTNWTLLVLNFALAVWSGACMMAALSSEASRALFWWKVALMSGVFTDVLFLHHVLALIGSKKRGVLIFGYAMAVTFQVFAIANLLDIKTRYAFNSYYMAPTGITLLTFVVLWSYIGFYASIILYNKMIHSEGQMRMQLKFLLIALVVAFLGGISHFIAVFFPKVYSFGNLLVSALPLVTTYGILRHKLLDIEVIIKKTLVFAGLLAALFAVLILPTLLIQEYILRTASFGAKMIGLAISGIIIILTMHRIENFLINVTDKYLFQKKYDYKELLRTFTNEVLMVVELDKLVNLTVSKMTDIIKLNSAAVLLFNDEEQQFEVVAQQNIKDPNVKLIRPDGIVTFMEETHGYILVKDLRTKKIFVPESIQDIIGKLNAELIIPMIVHEKVMGVLSLGKKKSDEDYSQDDLDILLPLAKTLAIAISNAQLFAELGKTQAEAAQKEKMATIGTLSAGINHEICNPLGIARGQCEAFLLNLKDGLYASKTNEELLAKAKDIMAKVIHETDRATAITKKLSQFAKPAKGDAELVNIDKEIDDALGLVNYELKLEKIEVEKHLGANLPNIFVDRKQLQEVLFNLIRNAGQAIGEKGKIIISAKEERGRVFIDIKDTGGGIPEDKIKQLFNPFFTTKDPGKGTGLGLFIVRQVIEKNGGRIYLKETKVSEGTTFTIEFPAADAASAQKTKAT